MNSNLTSSLSEFSKGRLAAEPSNRPPRSIVRNLITMARLWLGKAVSSAVARVLVIFFVGFAAGIRRRGEKVDRWLVPTAPCMVGTSGRAGWHVCRPDQSDDACSRYCAAKLRQARHRDQ